MNDSSPTSSMPHVEKRIPKSGWATRVLVLVFVTGLIGFAVWMFGDWLTLNSLASQELQFRQYKAAHPWLVIVVAFCAYVTVTGLSLPGATAMTLLMAWLFGFWQGLLLVSFASTSGATLAFLLSRYLLKRSVESRFGSKLQSFHKALEQEGAFYLFTLRLIPVVPFFVINVVMGVLPIKLWTYWWVSQLGMLPGTAAYVYAGSSVPSLKVLAESGLRGIVSPQLLVAFVIVGLLPFVIRIVLKKFRTRSGFTTDIERPQLPESDSNQLVTENGQHHSS